jgi:hypothetical protein
MIDDLQPPFLPFEDTFRDFYALLVAVIRAQGTTDVDGDVQKAVALADKFVTSCAGFNNRQRLLAVVQFMLMALEDLKRNQQDAQGPKGIQ